MGGRNDGNYREGADGGHDYAVVLPCEPDQFGQFVAGLLGRPQTISGRVRGEFEIDRGSIETTYHLIEQRILSQNEGTRISFSISISYDDASTVTLDSYEDFLSYTEIKPLIVTRIALSWVYLIRFRNKAVPERQQVDVWFSIDEEDGDFRRDVHLDPVLRYERHIERVLGRQGMTFRVMHTNRTWGGDLEALIASHLRTYLTPVKGIKAWMSSNSGWIGLLSGIAFEIASVAVLLRSLSQQTEEFIQRAKALAAESEVSIAQISHRLDLVVEILASRTISTQSLFSVIYLILSIIIACIVGGMIGSSSDFPTQSYILINKPSERRKHIFLDSRENSPLKFIFTVIGAVIIGVLGNIAYYYVAKQISLQ